METFKEMLSDIWTGIKAILQVLVGVALAIGSILGLVLAIGLLDGTFQFKWWYVPCLIVFGLIVAGTVGAIINSNRK